MKAGTQMAAIKYTNVTSAQFKEKTLFLNFIFTGLLLNKTEIKFPVQKPDMLIQECNSKVLLGTERDLAAIKSSEWKRSSGK